ncbi:MAG: hypothetical protein Q8Q14_10025 [Gemmatimonadales bacterium]|nr:hypothetical protein [Gemmatimonadales bacterium]
MADSDKLPTLWFCEECGVLGAVVGVDRPHDVMSGVQAIGDAHFTASPHCTRPRSLLRVLNLDAITVTGVLFRGRRRA